MSGIFVFGSNLAGRHGMGAALTAAKSHGAKYGVGEGLAGRSYAIPTKGRNLEVLGLVDLSSRVATFEKFVLSRPDLCFMVTAVGCGLAAYSASEVAPLFEAMSSQRNVYLPEEFCEVLGRRDRVSFFKNAGKSKRVGR